MVSQVHPFAIIFNGKDDVTFGLFRAHNRFIRLGVLYNIIQALLDNPENVDLKPGCKNVINIIQGLHKPDRK